MGGNEQQTASQSLEDVERIYIARVLEENLWNISRAARLLKIDRATLYHKIRRYSLQRPKENCGTCV